jgi:hypothetical protein
MVKLVLTAAVVGALFSQQPKVGTQGRQAPDGPTTDRPTPEHLRHDPWSGLFVAQQAGPAVAAPTLTIGLSAQVRHRSPERGPCNMPIVRANPEVDPKMVIPHRAEGVDAKIRVIEPTVCGIATAEKDR